MDTNFSGATNDTAFERSKEKNLITTTASSPDGTVKVFADHKGLKDEIKRAQLKMNRWKFIAANSGSNKTELKPSQISKGYQIDSNGITWIPLVAENLMGKLRDLNKKGFLCLPYITISKMPNCGEGEPGKISILIKDARTTSENSILFRSVSPVFTAESFLIHQSYSIPVADKKGLMLGYQYKDTVMDGTVCSLKVAWEPKYSADPSLFKEQEHSRIGIEKKEYQRVNDFRLALAAGNHSGLGVCSFVSEDSKSKLLQDQDMLTAPVKETMKIDAFAESSIMATSNTPGSKAIKDMSLEEYKEWKKHASSESFRAPSHPTLALKAK